MEEYVFETCHGINDLLIAQKSNEAREELIKLLDYHNKNDLRYSPLINHLIKETGLFPYIDKDTSDWEERFVVEAFKIDVGDVDNKTLHREQSFLLKKILNGESIAVSAPTSFGKSFIVDAFIKIKKPKNVLIIVPTIALTDETRRRLYRKFADEYKIITTADVELAEKNIFIFPQERAISYLNKVESFDIMIVDEFYKASAKFDKERAPSLIKAIIKIGEKSKQKYFLAPNISSLEENPFTTGMQFLKVEFNTVFLEKHELYKEINKDLDKKNKILIDILHQQAKTLIYAGTYSNIDNVSTLVLSTFPEVQNELLMDFADWLGKNYDYNWNLPNLIRRGTGIHNGRLHRSLSQIQVRLFEENQGINNIISTSSIIEGVNTCAENVVIWMNKNGKSNLNDFTYKNIIGRGGRMFKHFIGKIFILDKPPVSEETQLNLPFPEEILGDIDEVRYERVLTKEQIVKIKYYQEEMSNILGLDIFNKLRDENVFQSSNAELIKEIAIDISNNPESWNGLSFLNQLKPSSWDYLLYKIIKLQPGSWEVSYTVFVEFIKALSKNWFKTIPDLLKDLEQHDVSVDDFFKLERTVTFKFAALLKDINILQKHILSNKSYDISRFIMWISYAFLPPVVYQLEEYGLPRTISKKLHEKIINFYDRELTIHRAIEIFNGLGLSKIKQSVELDRFEIYILEYFFEGITNLKTKN